jgi:hypothetical protein
MRIEPADIIQVQRARDGRMVEIDQDAGNVAQDLKRIDPHLKVRFAENGNPPFWAVYHESDDNRSTYLVLTAKAYQVSSGVWTGLDQRIVQRIMEIGHSSYDYANELENANRAVKESAREAFREKVGGAASEAAWAARKDLGIKNRAVITRDI